MIKRVLRNKQTGQMIGEVAGETVASLQHFLSATIEFAPSADQAFTPPARDAMLDIRAKRNALLDSVAWTISPASPLSGLNKAAWTTYIKALHNVTNGLTDPTKVVWPTPPSGFEYSRL